MAAKMGFKAKMYYLGSGTRATWGAATNGIHIAAAPSGLTEMTNVRDLTLSLSKGEGDSTTRASNGWKTILAGLKEGSIEFEMMWDTTDASFAFFFQAWLNDTNVAVAALDADKATAGSQGLWADFVVTGFQKKEPLGEPQTVSVTIKPAYSTVAPEWVQTA